MDCKGLMQAIKNGKYDGAFSRLYGQDRVEEQRLRYSTAVEEFTALYGDAKEVFLFSAPGRTEIGGNHTDHNHGRVVAGSVNLDVIAVAAPVEGTLVHVKSQGFPEDMVDISYLVKDVAEINSSAALIRGVAAGFEDAGYKIGGFNAYTTSNVLKGSGLSSSAAFEVLLGTIFSHLYNRGSVSPVKVAQIAQFAENMFFGKPSGLMDQMASSVGGIITIDFRDTEKPEIKEIHYDFEKSGYRLCIVDVGGDHADLTHEYAAIPGEMREVAELLSCEYLRETSLEALLEKLPEIREKVGDRAALRAMHFFMENNRVGHMVDALEKGDFSAFLSIINESGASSYQYLQNVYCASNVREQPMSVALCLADQLLRGKGAWRVHGGGFGGTIQCFVPDDAVSSFRAAMEKVFGEGSCHILTIRQDGGVKLSAND